MWTEHSTEMKVKRVARGCRGCGVRGEERVECLIPSTIQRYFVFFIRKYILVTEVHVSLRLRVRLVWKPLASKCDGEPWELSLPENWIQ